MSKFSKNPLDTAIKSDIKDFINQAGEKTRPSIEYPWECLDDTEKVKGQNLRMTKADLAKVQYIAQTTPFSAQRFIYDAFRAALDKKIAEIIQQ